MKSRDRASAGVPARFVGGQRSCCRFRPPNVVSMPLNSAIRAAGPIICTQPEFNPASTRSISSNVSSPFIWIQSAPEIGSNAMPNELRMP